MVMKSTVPSATEAYALMTGCGSDCESIERSGMRRLSEACAGMPPEVRKVASPAFKDCADQRDAVLNGTGVIYQTGTLRTGIG